MPSYTESHQADYMRWVESRMAARRNGVALEPAQPAAMQAPSPAAHAMATRAFGDGQFSLSWSDVDELFTVIGGDTDYLIPGVAFADTDVDRLLRASAWSWAAITGNAKAMSLLAPVVQERVGGSWERAPDTHPLWTFLADPLGPDATLPYWPWSQLFYVTALHYYTGGNAYWKPVVVGGDVVAVVPILDPGSVKAEEDPVFKAPTVYVLPRQGQRPEARWAPDEIVNIMAPSAGSFWRGSSPLRAALRSVEIDHVATDRQRYNIRNRVSPGLTISLDKPLGPTPDQRKDTKAELMNDYSDRQDDGKPWIVGGGARVVPGVTPAELQVFETKRFAREEILAVIGMPPPVAGILDKAILNNFEVSNITWWNHHLFPVLQQIVNTVNSQMVQRHYGHGTRIWYDLSGTDVALQLLDARLDRGLKLQTLGYSTNDINTALDLGMETHDYLDIPNQQFIVSGRIQEIQDLLSDLKDGVLGNDKKPDAEPGKEPGPVPPTEAE